MGNSQQLIGKHSRSVTRSGWQEDGNHLLYFTGMRVGGKQNQFDARVTSRNPSQIWSPGSAGPPLGVI